MVTVFKFVLYNDQQMHTIISQIITLLHVYLLLFCTMANKCT